MEFKNWLKTHESTARKRRSLGIYPPQADDLIFKEPRYTKRFLDKVSKSHSKLYNMDLSSLKRKNEK